MRAEAVRELRLVHHPVAEPRLVGVPRAEPAVVDHEELDAELRGPLGQLPLAVLGDVELGGLPRVVEHGPGLADRALRQHRRLLEAVERARHRAEAGIAVPAVVGHRLQRLAGLETVGEIERVEASGDPDLVDRRPLDRQAEVAAPRERAEPDLAARLGRVLVDGEPGIRLVARVAAPALEQADALADRLPVQLVLARPSGRRRRSGGSRPRAAGSSRRRPARSRA